MTNDYPTEEQLEKIRTWDCQDLDGLIEYLGNEDYGVWHWPDWGVQKNEDGPWELHTGGWSGNEEIIDVMRENYMWWMLNWYSSRRGGHYVFENVNE